MLKARSPFESNMGGLSAAANQRLAEGGGRAHRRGSGRNYGFWVTDARPVGSRKIKTSNQSPSSHPGMDMDGCIPLPPLGTTPPLRIFSLSLSLLLLCVSWFSWPRRAVFPPPCVRSSPPTGPRQRGLPPATIISTYQAALWMLL